MSLLEITCAILLFTFLLLFFWPSYVKRCNYNIVALLLHLNKQTVKIKQKNLHSVLIKLHMDPNATDSSLQ